MIRKVLAAGLVLAGVSVAFAQNDPISQRRATMKGVGELWYGDLGKMMKGELAYDQAKVKTELDRIVAASKAMPGYFPDSSKTGDTKALPTVWEKKADFDARWKKLGDEAVAAQASIKDEASFKAAQPNLNKNCTECHGTYRAKAN